MLILSCIAAVFALHDSSSCRSAESYGHSDFRLDHDDLHGRRSLSPPAAPAFRNNEMPVQTLLVRSAREAFPSRSDFGSVSERGDLRDLEAVLVSQLPLPRTQPNRPVYARVGFARSRPGSSVVARTGALEGEWPRSDLAASDLAAVLAAQLPPLRRVSTCASALTYPNGIVSALSESVRRCSS